MGEVTYDLAYGGAFYAYVDLRKNKLELALDSNSYQDLIRKGMDVKHAVMKQDPEILHPFEGGFEFSLWHYFY